MKNKSFSSFKNLSPYKIWRQSVEKRRNYQYLKNPFLMIFDENSTFLKYDRFIKLLAKHLKAIWKCSFLNAKGVGKIGFSINLVKICLFRRQRVYILLNACGSVCVSMCLQSNNSKSCRQILTKLGRVVHFGHWPKKKLFEEN